MRLLRRKYAPPEGRQDWMKGLLKDAVARNLYAANHIFAWWILRYDDTDHLQDPPCFFKVCHGALHEGFGDAFSGPGGAERLVSASSPHAYELHWLFTGIRRGTEPAWERTTLAEWGVYANVLLQAAEIDPKKMLPKIAGLFTSVVSHDYEHITGSDGQPATCLQRKLEFSTDLAKEFFGSKMEQAMTVLASMSVAHVDGEVGEYMEAAKDGAKMWLETGPDADEGQQGAEGPVAPPSKETT